MSRRTKRQDSEYAASIKRLTKLAHIPTLIKLKRRKHFTRGEKSIITKIEKAFYHINADNIAPIKKADYEELKDLAIYPGVYAANFANTHHPKLKLIDENLYLVSNGRQYINMRLAPSVVKSKRNMQAAAKRAYAMRFPMDRVMEMAETVFADKPIRVYLWTSAGRAGEGFATFGAFSNWLQRNWGAGKYKHMEEWVMGLSVLVDEPEDDYETEGYIDYDEDLEEPF